MSEVTKTMTYRNARPVWVEQGIVDRCLSGNFTVKTILTIFQILGLAPITVENFSSLQRNRRHSTQDFIFKKSIFGLVYNCGLIITFFGVTFITVPLLRSGIQKHTVSLLDTFELAKGVTGLVVMFMIWLIVTWRYKTSLRILNKLVDMDNEMLVLHDLYSLQTSKRRMSILLISNFILWLSIFTLEIITAPENYKIWVPMLLPHIVMNWYTVQYILMLIIMEDRFISVNRSLIFISQSNIEPLFQVDIRPETVSERTIVNNFLALRKAYATFSEVCRDISEYYSFPILLTIAFFCGATIYHSYYLIVPFIIQSHQYTIPEISNMACFLMMETLPIFVLAVCVTRILSEMGTTGGTVYKVLARSVLSYVAKDEVKKFSFELLHKNVQFTAYGIFSLDCTLIQSIFGMLATYLIILIQFQLNHTQEEYHNLNVTTPTSLNQ